MPGPLIWGESSKHFYETGVKKGVLYTEGTLKDGSAYEYGTASVWNGLTAVTLSPSGAEVTPLFADGVKYFNLVSKEDFEYTIEAYYSPEEFDKCDGSLEIRQGIKAGQQKREHFGFSYVTTLGNDEEGNDYGYKIHLIYDSIASPSERAYATINDSPEAITLSWECSTMPAVISTSGFSPSAHIELNSTKFPRNSETWWRKAALTYVESMLYGSALSRVNLSANPDPVPEFNNADRSKYKVGDVFRYIYKGDKEYGIVIHPLFGSAIPPTNASWWRWIPPAVLDLLNNCSPCLPTPDQLITLTLYYERQKKWRCEKPEALSEGRRHLSATTVGNYALFGGGYQNSSKSKVDAYNSSLTHTIPTSFSEARYYLSATTVGNYALFGGGYQSNTTSTVDAYNSSLTHTTPTPLSEPRYQLAAATVGNYALFGGGRTSASSTANYSVTTVDAYNSSLTRTASTPLSVGRYQLSASNSSNYALFAGGLYQPDSVKCSTVDAYNSSLTHTTPTPLSVSKYNLAATTVGNYVLFGGGQASSNVVEAYDENLTRTTPMTLLFSRANCRASAINGYALFGGGQSSSSYPLPVEAYDENLIRTTPIELSEGRYYLSATTVGDRALFAGGMPETVSSTVDAISYTT